MPQRSYILRVLALIGLFWGTTLGLTLALPVLVQANGPVYYQKLDKSNGFLCLDIDENQDGIFYTGQGPTSVTIQLTDGRQFYHSNDVSPDLIFDGEGPVDDLELTTIYLPVSKKLPHPPTLQVQ